MGTTYDGIPGNIAYPTPVTISSTTNTNPIAVTTAAPHGLLTGDKARIYDHQVNTPANGIWTVTRTGASTYTIPVAGIGAGAATGSSQALTYGTALTLPADNDANAAATFNAAFAPLSDRSAAVLPNIGQFKLARREIIQYTSLSAAGQWCVIAAGGVVANTPIQFFANSVAWGGALGSLIATPVGGQPPVFALGGVVFGDYVDVRLDTTFVADGVTGGRLVLYGAIIAPGVAAPVWPGGGYAQLSGGSAYNADSGSGGALGAQVSLHGIINISSATGNLYLQPVYYPYNTGTQSPSCRGDTLLTVDIWRPTGVPQ